MSPRPPDEYSRACACAFFPPSLPRTLSLIAAILERMITPAGVQDMLSLEDLLEEQFFSTPLAGGGLEKPSFKVSTRAKEALKASTDAFIQRVAEEQERLDRQRKGRLKEADRRKKEERREKERSRQVVTSYKVRKSSKGVKVCGPAWEGCVRGSPVGLVTSARALLGDAYLTSRPSPMDHRLHVPPSTAQPVPELMAAPIAAPATKTTAPPPPAGAPPPPPPAGGAPPPPPPAGGAPPGAPPGALPGYGIMQCLCHMLPAAVAEARTPDAGSLVLLWTWARCREPCASLDVGQMKGASCFFFGRGPDDCS